MRLSTAARAVLVLAQVLVGSACASSGRAVPAEDGARPAAVVVPTFTVAPPPPPPPPPAASSAPSLEPAANPACTLTASGELARSIPLHLDDSGPFFHVNEGKSIELRLASPRSTARASTSELEIIGHVKPSDLPVRLRSGALVDGYLRVNHATLRDGDPTRLELVADPPWFVKPVKDPVVAVGCDELALARAISRADEVFGGKHVDLRIGAPIALRATPSGPVVATITVPKSDSTFADMGVDAYQVDRRGEQVRVVIPWDASDVEGWVSRRDVSPHADDDMMGGLLGSLDGGGATIALASDAPLLVHTGGRVVRVGTARPATHGCVKPANADAREIELDLDGPFGGLGVGEWGPGSGPQPAVAKLFVIPARGEACVNLPR